MNLWVSSFVFAAIGSPRLATTMGTNSVVSEGIAEWEIIWPQLCFPFPYLDAPWNADPKPGVLKLGHKS